MTAVRQFELQPRGAFSLAEANAFGFGHRAPQQGEAMVMAFAADGTHEPVGVVLRQATPDGAVRAELHGDAPTPVAAAQTARILSLDHDGTPWASILDADPVLARLATAMPGLRPVLFHSPYEAAAWSVISARRHHRQGAAIRDRIAERLGTTFALAGQTLHAFPPPERLLSDLQAGDGLTDEHVGRLKGIAEAAGAGDLEAAELRRVGVDEAMQRVLRLRGIGPFYAMLIVLRATGFADAPPAAEPRLRAAMGKAYDLGGPASDGRAAEIAEAWRPLRIWAGVTFRAAVERGLI